MSGPKSTTATISFSKAGTITFNPLSCERIGLVAGSKISIAQDEDAPENWYVFVDEENGFELRCKDPQKDKACTFNHKALCTTIIEACGLPTDETHRFLIGGEPTPLGKTNYWGILIPV